jgi:hypothetical protein
MVFVAAIAVGACERRDLDPAGSGGQDRNRIELDQDVSGTTPPATTLPDQTVQTPTQPDPSVPSNQPPDTLPGEAGPGQPADTTPATPAPGTPTDTLPGAPGTATPVEPGTGGPTGMNLPDTSGTGANQASGQTMGAIQGTSTTGVIEDVDLNRGVVTINKGQEKMMVHAKPSQISNLRKGDRLSGNVAMIGNEHWLMDDIQKKPIGTKLGRAGSVTGNISTVEKETGMVTVTTPTGEMVTLQAHPAEIDQLVPGEHVTITFHKLGDKSWISSVGPTEEPARDEGV